MDFSNEAIKIFSAAYPDITFRQVQESTQRVFEMLRSGQVETAVTTSDMSDDGITSTIVLDEPMYVMIPSVFGFEGCGSVRMEELAGLPLITQTEGYGISRLINSFYEKAGIHPGRVRKVQEQESITIQAINDYGIGFLPESVANSQVPRTMFGAVNSTPIPVTDSFCRRQVYLTLRNERKHTQSIDGFLDYLCSFGRFATERSRFPEPEEVTVTGHYTLKL